MILQINSLYFCYVMAVHIAMSTDLFFLFFFFQRKKRKGKKYSVNVCAFVVFPILKEKKNDNIDDIKLLNFLLLTKQTTNCIVLMIEQCVWRVFFVFFLLWLDLQLLYAYRNTYLASFIHSFVHSLNKWTLIAHN